MEVRLSFARRGNEPSRAVAVNKRVSNVVPLIPSCSAMRTETKDDRVYADNNRGAERAEPH